MSVQERLVRSALWLAGSKTLVQGLSLVSTFAVARILQPADYGVMALAGLLIGVSALVSEFGAGAAIIQYPDLERRELNGLFWGPVALSLAAYGVLFAAAPAVAAWFENPALGPVLRVAGLSLPLASLRVVPENLLRKQLAFDRIAKAHVVSALAAIPTTLLLALAGAGVWSLVASSLVMASVQALAMFANAGWLPSLEVGSARAGALFRFCRHTLGGRVCWAVYQQTDVLFLSKYAPVPSVGVYSMAMQLVAFPIDKVFSLVNEISYPAMARVQQDVETLRRSALRSFKLVALLAFPIYGGLALVADDLVRLALTEKWLGAVPIVRILAAYGALSSLAVLLAPLLLARYRPDVVFRYSFAQMLIMPAAFWAGSASGGPAGVAVAWTLAYPLALSWLAREALAELRLRAGEVARALLPAAASAIAMGGAVVAVRAILQAWLPEHGALRLALSVAAGVACYGGATWLLDRAFVAELARLARAATRPSARVTPEQRA